MLIHKFAFADKFFVVDINSGAVHIVDDLVYDLLDVFDGQNYKLTYDSFCDKYDEHQLKQCLDELKELVQEGMLFSNPVEARDVFTDEPIVKSLCLHVAHDCNLRCEYCFASTGDFTGDRSIMSLEIGKKAIDFAICESKMRQNLDIDFFGGEPLVNWSVVKELVHYAREQEKKANKNIKLTLTTNGVLLDDEKIEFLNEHNILLVLSLDGRPQVQNKMRPLVGGQGSYGKVVTNFKKLINSRGGKNYYLRGTYTKENFDFKEDVEHMLSVGDQLSIEPVVEKDNWYKIDESNLPKIFAEYERLSHFYLQKYKEGKGFNFFHFNMALDGGPCLSKRLSGCGAGHEYFAITPEGDIYPCHQFVGRQEYLLGNISTGIERLDISQNFRRANVLNKSICQECWARFYCSGGCHANADLMNGDIYKPYEIGCKLQKKRLECAIAIQALIAGGEV